MPVRSLNSSVLKWPDVGQVHEAINCWAEDAALQQPGVLRIGYFGSYARGDWGVGSDLDIVIVVKGSDVPFISRASCWDTSELPVPADVLVYTESEWRRMDDGSRFSKMLNRETIWVYNRTEEL